MVTLTPKQQLPKADGSDNARDYIKGAIGGGGLWAALEKLDEVVLLTGAQTLAGKTLTAPVLTSPVINTPTGDVVTPAGVQTLTNKSLTSPVITGNLGAGPIGIGVAPAAWDASRSALQLGQTGAVWGAPGGDLAGLSSNTVLTGSNKAIITGAASQLFLQGAVLVVANAASVAAGAVQSMTARLTIGANGMALFASDAASPSIQVTDYITSSTAGLRLHGSNSSVTGHSDGTTNLGTASVRWGTVFAVAGAINTSSIKYKHARGDLDPEAALRAVLRTPARRFAYKGSERVQAGYYLEEADPLFTIGPEEASPSNDVGILLGAFQALAARLGITALEGAR